MLFFRCANWHEDGFRRLARIWDGQSRSISCRTITCLGTSNAVLGRWSTRVRRTLLHLGEPFEGIEDDWDDTKIRESVRLPDNWWEEVSALREFMNDVDAVALGIAEKEPDSHTGKPPRPAVGLESATASATPSEAVPEGGTKRSAGRNKWYKGAPASNSDFKHGPIESTLKNLAAWL